MELTEQEDNFQLWCDTIKEHHPDIKLDQNTIDLLMDTFMAGYWAGSTGIDMKAIAEGYNPQMH